MPILPFGKKSRPLDHFLAIETDTAGVKCVAFQAYTNLEDLPTAKIVGISHKVATTPLVNSAQTLDLLTDCVADCLTNLDRPTKKVLVGLKGEHSFGFTTRTRVGRNTQTPVTRKELEHMFQKTLDIAYTKAQAELFQQTGKANDKLELLNSSVIYTKVDGNPILNPIGQEASTLEMAIFTSYCPKYILRKIKKLFAKAHLSIELIGLDLHSLSGLLEKSDLENTNYLIIDMGSDCTSVGVVFGKALVATKSLPIGRNHFVKELSQNLGITFEDASTMLRDYSRSKLSESENMVIRNLLETVLELWLTGMELLFSEFSGIKTFAAKIYLVGEGFDVSDIYEFIVTEPWTKSIPFKEPPEFSKIDLAELPGISDTTGKASTLSWLAIASLAHLIVEDTSYDKD